MELDRNMILCADNLEAEEKRVRNKIVSRPVELIKMLNAKLTFDSSTCDS